MTKRIISILAITLLITACSNSDDSGNKQSSSDDFDRSQMLVNWADNIIIPVYEDLDDKLDLLVAAKNVFITTPNQTNLDDFRQAWLDAYKVWQYAEMFNIGKAEAINYGFQMNIYPASVTDIETNVANGTYDLSHVNNNDAVGFPALDYLLYGVADTDAGIITVYTTQTNAEQYKTYVSDLVERMKVLTDTVLQDWKSGYRDTFVSSTGNTATSATNMLVNDYIYYTEKGLRSNKIGIPAGAFSTALYPDKVEAFYKNDVSKMLALEGLKATRDLFNGKAYKNSASGTSLSDYLNYLQTITGGEDLTTLINTQFGNAETRIQDLNASFSNQVTTDNTKMTLAFDALQKVVVLLKVDMVQAMNISVDYVDADGD